MAGNNATPGHSGTVSGTVLVFPPSSDYNCPVINYTATRVVFGLEHHGWDHGNDLVYLDG